MDPPRACTHIVIAVLNNNYLHMQSIPINRYYLTGNIYQIIHLHTEEQEHKWLNTVSQKGYHLFFHKPGRWKEKVMNTSVSIISVAGYFKTKIYVHKGFEIAAKLKRHYDAILRANSECKRKAIDGNVKLLRDQENITLYIYPHLIISK